MTPASQWAAFLSVQGVATVFGLCVTLLGLEAALRWFGRAGELAS